MTRQRSLAPATPGDRAAMDQQLAAIRAARGWYGQNAPVGDPDVGDPVVRELVFGSPLLTRDPLCTGMNHLIVASTGITPVVVPGTEGGYRCAGLKLDGLPFETEPLPTLDDAVRAVSSWTYSCDRCGGNVPAALLPVPHLPHLVVFGVCAGCVWTLEQSYPDCHFIPKGK